VLKRATYLMLALLLVAVGMAALLLYESLPPAEGEVALAGLNGPTRVAFDEFGIPAVQASSHADMLRILGYLHARDRLFQMELMHSSPPPKPS
jgi:penicillin G amidase